MRVPCIAFATGLALLAGTTLANAAPILPAPMNHKGKVEQVAWYCGWGHHLNRWGRCVRNRYAYYGHPSWYSPYYRWHSPNDFVANDLNRRELGRYHWGY
jgi:hypothetical protein